MSQLAGCTGSAATTIVGVDGCRQGWLAVARTPDGLAHGVYQRFAELIEAWRSAEFIFVDIPIGLPSRSTPSRLCDSEARRCLGPGRASSVFSPPCREAALAPEIGLAREINVRELGRSLSAQAWGICTKIAEVDTILRAGARLRSQVLEVHPELCFWALNDEKPMRHPKKTPQGEAERVALLEKLEPRARELIRRVLEGHPRSSVARDDVIDALAALLTGYGTPGSRATIPTAAVHDDAGLPMRMWVRTAPTRQSVR